VQVRVRDFDLENERPDVFVTHDTTARFVVSATGWPSTNFCSSQRDRAKVDKVDELDLMQGNAELINAMQGYHL